MCSRIRCRLSALALQLESTRLLARERGVDHDIARALDQAHHLAAGGLQDARRAIATARGDELPGQMKSRGVDVDETVMRMGDPVPPMFFFRDLDGNRFMAVQRA